MRYAPGFAARLRGKLLSCCATDLYLDGLSRANQQAWHADLYATSDYVGGIGVAAPRPPEPRNA